MDHDRGDEVSQLPSGGGGIGLCQKDVASVLQTIRKAGGQLLENVDLLDRYSGSPIPEGSCRLAVRLRFRDPKATLRDEQVDPLLNKVRQSLEKSFKAELRC